MRLRTSRWVAVIVGMTVAACGSDSKIEVRGGSPVSSENLPDDVSVGEQDGGLDTGVNSGMIDSGMVDSGMVDSGMVDSGMVDSGVVAEPDVVQGSDTVEVSQPSVSFVSPTDGASVANPVKFKIAAARVSTVQIEADGWPLASTPWDPSRNDTHEYDFSGTGYEREVVLFGFDAQGREVAKDTIRITVKAPVIDEPPPPGKGTSLGSFVNTYYYVEDENDHTGAATSKFHDRDCNVLANVPASFARLACIEGTAKLKDGRVVNYATNRTCANSACSFTWGVMDARFPWGQGNRANALVPLKSWAVDTAVIANGTVVYVEEWDGKVIPKLGTIGGITHDGCFRADDVGGGIKGKHVDIFSGSKAMYRELNRTFPTRTSFTVYKDSPRCAHFR